MSAPTEKIDVGTGFGAAADAYARWRPTYPQSVFDGLLDALAGPRAVAVDLGAGAGAATGDMAERFGSVIAVEPDARMAARIPPRDNVDILVSAAEEAAFAPGSVDAVIAATSFHWMDQPRVIGHVRRWLRPGGVFFPLLFGPFEVEGPARDAFRRHRALWSPFRDPRLGAKANYGEALQQSGAFHRLQTFSDEQRREMSPEDAAHLFMTTSYARAYAAAGPGAEAYGAALAHDLAIAGGSVSVRFPLGGVLAIDPVPQPAP